MNCGVGRRRGSDLALLWLWHRLAATALIRPLAWEPPYATSAALERTKDQKKKKERERKKNRDLINLFCERPASKASNYFRLCRVYGLTVTQLYIIKVAIEICRQMGVAVFQQNL